jgi:hypothetical protein
MSGWFAFWAALVTGVIVLNVVCIRVELARISQALEILACRPQWRGPWEDQ